MKTSPRPLFNVQRSHIFKILSVLSLLSVPLLAQDTPPAAESSDTFSPPEYSIDRYQKLRGKSPFEFELAKPKEEATVDPFADLVLAGYAGSASHPTVYVVNTKTQERLTILPEGGSKKDTTGFKVLSINRGRNLATTTVNVEKDGVQKELSFDPKVLSSMTAGATGGQPGAAPGARLPGVFGQQQNGSNGQPMIRPTMVPGQTGQPGQPAKFQAPQAFIPGQSNRNSSQPGVNLAPMASASNIQIGGQTGGATPVANTETQQQLNVLLNSNTTNTSQAQAAAPTAGTPIPGTQFVRQDNPPPRRRVVLPTNP